MKPDGRVAGMVQRVAATNTFLRYAPTVVPKIDHLLHRATKGKMMMSSLMLPTMTLTTTGRRSGEPRSVPLATIALDDGLHIVGSNWGGATDPAWALNLVADPACHVVFEGDSFDASAELLDPEQKAAAWPSLTAVWPVYDRYVERSNRDLKVFRITRR